MSIGYTHLLLLFDSNIVLAFCLQKFVEALLFSETNLDDSKGIQKWVLKAVTSMNSNNIDVRFEIHRGGIHLSNHFPQVPDDPDFEER